MSKEDAVVEAALACVRAHDAGSSAQAEEAMNNLRDATGVLLAQDRRREKPRWQTTRETLGLDSGVPA